MSASPERRHPLIDVDNALLQAMLAAALPGWRLLSATLLTGGFSNTTYKLTCADHPFVVLRIMAREPQVSRKEAAIFQLVDGTVPTPRILFNDMTGERFGHPYSVMTWCDGVTLNTVLATQDSDAIGKCAYAAGKTLAHIGSFPFPHAGFFGPDLTVPQPFGPWREVLIEYVATCLFSGHASRWLGEALTAQLWQMVLAKAGYLDDVPDGATLGHGDFKGQNILVVPAPATWHVTAVLDWEFAFAGTPLIDLGIFLRYAETLPISYTSEALRGYTEHGGILPDTWRPIIKLLDLFNLCDFLNSPQPRPILYAEIITLIRQTIALFASEGR